MIVHYHTAAHCHTLSNHYHSCRCHTLSGIGMCNWLGTLTFQYMVSQYSCLLFPCLLLPSSYSLMLKRKAWDVRLQKLGQSMRTHRIAIQSYIHAHANLILWHWIAINAYTREGGYTTWYVAFRYDISDIKYLCITLGVSLSVDSQSNHRLFIFRKASLIKLHKEKPG